MTKRLLPLALIALTALPLSAQQPPPPKPNVPGSAHEAPQSQAPAPDTPSETPAPDDQADAPDNADAAPEDIYPDIPLVPGTAGAYLAARQASMDNDFVTAAQYYDTALGAGGTDPFLQDSALVSLISAGEVDKAVELANRTTDENQATALAKLVHQIDAAKKGDWDRVIALTAKDDGDKSDQAEEDGDGEGHLLDGLIRAWALLGSGKASDAIASFENLAKLPGARDMVNYQLALAKAKVGDYEAAEKLLRGDAEQGHILGIIARAEALSQLERGKEALAMLNDMPDLGDEPALLATRDRLAKGETLPFDVVKGSQDGIAQVLTTFGTALAAGDEPDPLALVQARLASYLSPDLGEARLLSAQLLQSLGQFDLAEQEFKTLSEKGEMRPVAEIARIDALARADRIDDAVNAAKALTKAYPGLPQGWIALGDLLRQQEKFAESVDPYDQALTLLKDADPRARWFPLYARGIALERSGEFDKAEADMRAALKIQPNSAPVLNYLGYSLVDRNIKLDEALKMIQRAVELSPNDGYILDSLAWAYFRLGRYQDAVAPMERAVSSMATDALVNDHMGDIYWMVGRKREAEIQWHRALSFKPETPEEEARIKAKLERGLDAVLEGEKANGGKLPATAPAPTPEPDPAD